MGLKMWKSAVTTCAMCVFLVSVMGDEALSKATFDREAPVTSSLLDQEQPFRSLFRPYLDFMDRVFQRLEENSTSLDNDECQIQTKQLMDFAEAGDAGALSFFDATGKPSSGVLKGGVSMLGYYSQCLEAKIKNGSIEHPAVGKYCLIRFSFVNESTFPFPKVFFDVFQQAQNQPFIGVCVPSACSTEDVGLAFNKSSTSLFGQIDECYIKEDNTIDAAAACILAIFVIFSAIAIFATVYDLNQKCFSTKMIPPKPTISSISYGTSTTEMISSKVSLDESISCQEIGSTIQLHHAKSKDDVKGDHALKPFILAFSLNRNAAKVFSVEQTSDSVASLHGLRFLSMALIIFGHTFSFATQDMSFRNSDATSEAPKSFVAQILSNGTLAVDTFYFISGLLVALVTLKVMAHKDGKLPLLHFYLHRYIRLTPLLMIVIAFTSTLLQYVSSGPRWNFSIMMYSAWCKINWYWNALYVQNFVHTPEMCLSHSWYLATDMQFYIVTPLIIIPLYKNRLWGAIVLGAFLVATTVTTGVITAINNFPAIPYINNAVPLEIVNKYYDQVYLKPYCRMGPYLIGIIIGYILWEHKVITIKKLYVTIGWVLTAFLMLFVLFIMRGANEGHLPSTSIAAAYSALARTAWATGLGWLTLMCHYGYGGFVNSILAFKYFMPLSRLTYSAYLIHPVVMAIYYGSVETTVDFSYSFMLYLFIGNCVITYVISLILSLLFESPIIGLEKACQKRK